MFFLSSSSPQSEGAASDPDNYRFNPDNNNSDNKPKTKAKSRSKKAAIQMDQSSPPSQEQQQEQQQQPPPSPTHGITPPAYPIDSALVVDPSLAPAAAAGAAAAVAPTVQPQQPSATAGETNNPPATNTADADKSKFKYCYHCGGKL